MNTNILKTINFNFLTSIKTVFLTLYRWETVYIMDTLRYHKNSSLPLNNEEKQIFYSKEWGSLLFCSPNQKPTLYCDIITSNSSVAVPSVEFVASNGLDYDLKKFESQGNMLSGFHPSPLTNMLVPKDLLKVVKK